MLTVITFGLVAITPFFIYQYIELGVPSVSVAVVVTVLAGLANLAWARHKSDSRLGGWGATSVLFALLVFSNLQSGGFYDPNFGWLYVFPMLAALLVDARAGWVFTGLVLALTVAFWLAPEYGVVIPDRIPADQHAQQSLANRVSAVLVIGLILAAIQSQQGFARRLLGQSNQELQDEIERRARMQQQLIRTERAASMGNLAAGLAHEINNPLTYVIGNLDALKLEYEEGAENATPFEPEEAQRLVEEALEGAWRVADLVRDLNNFSRVDEAELRPVALAPAIEGASRLVANELRHRARLEVECDEALHVLGNQGRLQQVLLNLMMNAAQATAVGTAEENLVRVCARQDAEEVSITISDTGRGISPENAERIFEPFFTTRGADQGIGLGLFITRNIIKSMGGRIEVDSTPGEGSTFSISLPSGDVAAEPSASPRAEEVEEQRGAAPRAVRILAIDDEESVLVYLRRALAHHHVTTETKPLAAIERICEATDDVVLCDLMMPEMTGMDLHREVQRRRPDLAQRMLFMTAGILVEENRDFLATVAGRWIEKPIRIAQLERLIAERLQATEPAPGGGSPPGGIA